MIRIDIFGLRSALSSLEYCVPQNGINTDFLQEHRNRQQHEGGLEGLGCAHDFFHLSVFPARPLKNRTREDGEVIGKFRRSIDLLERTNAKLPPSQKPRRMTPKARSGVRHWIGIIFSPCTVLMNWGALWRIVGTLSFATEFGAPVQNRQDAGLLASQIARCRPTAPCLDEPSICIRISDRGDVPKAQAPWKTGCPLPFGCERFYQRRQRSDGSVARPYSPVAGGDPLRAALPECLPISLHVGGRQDVPVPYPDTGIRRRVVIMFLQGTYSFVICYRRRNGRQRQ